MKQSLVARKTAGFTLVELMVVVVIIGVLAAIALPSYENHIRKAKRAECEGVLMKVAGIAERRKSATMTYKPPPPPAEDILANGNLYCPMEGGSAGGGDRDYTVTYEATSDTAFLVTATPIGRQSADRCGTLTLDNLGEKTASGVPPLTLEDCW